MNSKKKIIDTIRCADKASVEKLMAEEAKKNEIFAKAQRRANIEQTEYADSVSGVEKYERRISMTKIASIAAAAVLLVGSIGGGAYLFKKGGEPGIPEPELNKATTTSADTTETVTTVSGTKTGKTSKANQTTVTTSVTTTVTGDAKTTEKGTSNSGETQTNEEKQPENKYSVTKEELIKKVENYKYLGSFDKFSSDYSYTIYAGEWRKDEEHKGRIYLDEVGLTASAEDTRYNGEKRLTTSLFAVKDKKYIEATEALAEIDYNNGGYNFYDTPIKTYEISSAYGTGDWFDSKVNITSVPGCCTMAVNVHAPNEWDITGERTEKGRKILTISGSSNSNEFGVECTYTGEVDAATGITLSYESYLPDGTPSYIYKAENYKFDDEAVEFRTPAEIVKQIKDGGFTNRFTDGDGVESLNW